MNDIEKFRKRRDKRLKARFDDDISWVTTEEGAHIPLVGGKSIGGWSKGKDFSSAKSERSVAKGTESATRELNRKLKNAKKEDYGYILDHAKEGAKIFVRSYGGAITGYKKRQSGLEGSWEIIMGGGRKKKGDIVAYYVPEIAAKNATYIGTNLRDARAKQSEKYPLRDEKMGTRKEVNVGGTGKVTAVYKKGVSNTKELFDVFAKNTKGVGVSAMSRAKEEGAKVEEVGQYNPKNRTVTVKDVKGNEYKYKVKLTGTKVTTVDGDGKVVGEPEYDYHYKLVKI